jgi:hypothetical protein
MIEPEDAATAEEAAQALGITQLVPAIYRDLLQPAARETGQRLVVVARAVGIALAPLEVAVWGYERIREYLAAAVAAKLAAKAPEEIRSPDLTIAGPAVLNMAFTAEAPHLREMYATLLAHATHTPSAPKVHPSFVQIIQQLSPAEAEILRHIATIHHTDAVLFQETLHGGAGGGANVGGPYISTQWQEFCASCGVTDESAPDVLYHNLIRLGLLAERTEADSRQSKSIFGEEHVTTITVNFLMLTAYGSRFLDVCVRDA